MYIKETFWMAFPFQGSKYKECTYVNEIGVSAIISISKMCSFVSSHVSPCCWMFLSLQLVENRRSHVFNSLISFWKHFFFTLMFLYSVIGWNSHITCISCNSSIVFWKHFFFFSRWIQKRRIYCFSWLNKNRKDRQHVIRNFFFLKQWRY